MAHTTTVYRFIDQPVPTHTEEEADALVDKYLAQMIEQEFPDGIPVALMDDIAHLRTWAFKRLFYDKTLTIDDL